ncbi:urease accessory protein UreF [Minwuia sp.]|uniref:urease accessory protein UreF n=1 Tax=Minwuia sp. TaxID=2493630 RepID=UPI003A8DDA52
MTDALELLGAMQFADGLFPAGGFATSNGLEQMAGGRRIPGPRLDAFFAQEIEGRFGPFERVITVLAHRNHRAPDHLIALDARVERMTWVSAQRTASAQAGRGLLMAASKLSLPGAAELMTRVRADRLRPHQPVALGAVLAMAGIAEHTAQLVAGHRFLAGLANAAIRLGLTGAIGAQQAVTRHRADLARWADEPVPDDALPTSFSPSADIAMMRHRRSDARLFAT